MRRTPARLGLGDRLDDAIGILEGDDLAGRCFGPLGGLVATRPQRRRRRLLALADHSEVDLAPVEVDAADLDANARADHVAQARALATQLLANLAKRKRLSAQSVTDKPLEVQAASLRTQSEARQRADRAPELLAQVSRVSGTEPGLDALRRPSRRGARCAAVREAISQPRARRGAPRRGGGEAERGVLGRLAPRRGVLLSRRFSARRRSRSAAVEGAL